MSIVCIEQVASALEQIGYSVQLPGERRIYHYSVSGLTCGNCIKAVEEVLVSTRIDGVDRVIRCVDINLKQGIAIISAPNNIDENIIIDAVDSIGFECTPMNRDRDKCISSKTNTTSVDNIDLNTTSPLHDINKENNSCDTTTIINADTDAVTITTLDVRGMTCGSCVASVER